MRLLRTYLRREIVGATLLVLAAFLGLFAFFDFLAELERVGRAGYRLKHALIFVALSIPSRAYEIMPIAVLIGSLYALTTLARNSEITVMRTAGVSNLRMLGALMRIGLVFAAATFVLGEYVAPPLERLGQKWRLRSANATVPQELRTGLWVRDGQLFVNIQRARPDAELEGIRIYEFDKAHRLMSISQAATGVYSVQEGWRLEQVVQTRFEEDRVSVHQMPSLQWSSQLTPEMINVVMVTPERMAISSLRGYVRHLEENKQRTGRYEVAYWKKILYPFAVLVMMGLALPFAFGNQRSANVGARVLVGVMLGMVFHLLNSLAANLGVLNAWPPLLTATAPSLLFLGLAAFMLWTTQRR